MPDSLWGEEFVIEKKPPKQIIRKASKPRSMNVVDKVTERTLSVLSLKSQLEMIRVNVEKILGRYSENVETICTREELHDYIDTAIMNGEIAIDTETNNSLDPITCLLMGGCIYTPGRKSAYIPVNHVDPDTHERLPDQVTESDIKEEFSRLADTKIIMHNGKFDYEVLKCTCGVVLHVFWDTMVAVRILDENEKRAGLKEQYRDKIDPSVDKYSIEHLFEGVEYAVVDPKLFALYAATDAYITYELYKWQQIQFDKPGNERIKKLFLDVEMPVMEVSAEMELAGTEIDIEYAKRLSDKYHKALDNVEKQIAEQLEKYQPQIEEWRKTPDAMFQPRSKKPNKNGEYTLQKSKSQKLLDPPQLSSPTQFAILLYDVLKVPVIDKSSPRGTGEDILLKIDNPLCKLVLEQRGIDKLISTYIDKLPKCVNPVDGRLHAHFNQLGTDTGRFSSSDPNLQNIPSHDKAIRMMFKASEGCVMVGSDFSQQEPRLLSALSQDHKMIEAYQQGKDLYATIASGVYKNTYWDNMEKHEDGSPNPEGKKRRGNCKSLLLGIMYGRGAASIADQIHSDLKGAQKIIDDFYTGFPQVKEWVDTTEKDAKINGYVEDLWGRRRRLPDLQLPKYTITDKTSSSNSSDVNPLFGSRGLVYKVRNPNIDKYSKLLESARGWQQVNKIKEQANAEGIDIRDNGAFIAKAERQCVNARVQGSAATMSKKAMIKVYRDEELKRLGFRMLLQVHDELIGECPVENADAVADRLTYVMKNSVADDVSVPFKCDADISPCWYYSDYKDILVEEFKNKLSTGKLKQDAFNDIVLEHTECTIEQLKDFLKEVL